MANPLPNRYWHTLKEINEHDAPTYNVLHERLAPRGHYGITYGDHGSGRSTYIRMQSLKVAEAGHKVLWIVDEDSPHHILSSLKRLGVTLTDKQLANISTFVFNDIKHTSGASMFKIWLDIYRKEENHSVPDAFDLIVLDPLESLEERMRSSKLHPLYFHSLYPNAAIECIVHDDHSVKPMLSSIASIERRIYSFSSGSEGISPWLYDVFIKLPDDTTRLLVTYKNKFADTIIKPHPDTTNKPGVKVTHPSEGFETYSINKTTGKETIGSVTASINPEIRD